MRGASAMDGFFSTFGTGFSMQIARHPLTGVFSNVNTAAAAINLNTASANSSISFWTTNTNNVTPTQRMAIDKDGNVDIVDGNLKFAAGHGIDFSATANSATSGTSNSPSELFDDYEEGTWTPSITAYTGTQPTVTIATGYSVSGHYTKVGNLVHVNFYIPNFSVSGTTSGILWISGLPYNGAVKGSDNGASLSHYKLTFVRGANGSITLRCFSGTNLGILTSDSGGTWGWELVSCCAGGTQRYISGTITYKTNV